MAKLTSQDRRKQILKQRRAEGQREDDKWESRSLFDQAFHANRAGDAPAADRLLKRALVLDPEQADALNLLAQIHEDAGHHAEALAYLLRLRKLIGDPTVLFNTGVIYHAMKQYDKASGTMAEFLAATKALREPKWQGLRASANTVKASAQIAQANRAAEISRAAQAVAKSPGTAAPVPAGSSPPKPETPTPPDSLAKSAKQDSLGVQFLPDATVDFSLTGTLADYFLRRQWIDLRLAQNFEDLRCLPSLQGVDVYVHQQETVRKVLRHFKGRALLADEVGLGKTIEACLVLKEYWLRGLVRRALVLAPPSLVSQWRGELIEKFGMAPVSPDGAEFRRDSRRFWEAEPLVVASIAMARLDPHAAAIAAVPWDMVIVDEAHCLKNRASANWQLVDSLQKKFILMLTATPVENNLIELYNLITLLKPGLLATEADFRKTHTTPGKPHAPKSPQQLRAMLGEVMVRNTRAAVDVKLPHRIAATVAVHPSETEARLYESVSHFVAGHYATVNGNSSPRLALHWLQRQAGSSPVALSRSLARALREESWVQSADRRELENMLDLASSLDLEWSGGGSGESGKAAELGRMLSGHPGKAVVFTEFVPTLDFLRRVCDRHGISYALFSGDLSRAEKDAAVARFRDEAGVLLSTGAGGEGRNLQFADTVVNFDLPWNPMRIEQRIGRVHRIGQSRDVFVFNFCQTGTVEEQLLRVLHDKINMFELVVGEMDAILGSLDENKDFGELVLDLWIAGRQSGAVERAFDELAGRLLEAKKRHVKTQGLEDLLFASDFEV